MTENNSSYQSKNGEDGTTVAIYTQGLFLSDEKCPDCDGPLYVHNNNTTSGYPLIKKCLKCGWWSYV